MDRNITMALIAVILLAVGIIVFSFLSKVKCPNDIKIDVPPIEYKIGDKVSFMVNTKLETAKYEWIIDGKPTYTSPSPKHIFNKPGEKTIEVKVNEGCRDLKIITIRDTAKVVEVRPNIKPFEMSKTSVKVGEVIQFKSMSENVSAVFWDFGDNKTTSELSNPSHVYDKSGTYTVSVMYNGDESLTNTQQITIKRIPISRVTPVIPPKPQPQITHRFRTLPGITAGVETQFFDETPGATEWFWDFNDTKTSRERNPKHTYQSGGTYVVALTTTVNNRPAKIIQKIKVAGSSVYAPLREVVSSKPESIPVVTKPDNAEPQGRLDSTGVPISARQASCSTPSTESYSFTLTPKQAVELIEFTVFSDRCGGLKVSIEGETIKSGLNPGQNQILLSGLNKTLKKGQPYTVTCTTIAGYACSDTQKPKLENGKACNGHSKFSSHLTINDNNQSIIYNLQYLY